MSTSLPRLVMASGVFDCFHRGHYNLLHRAAQLGDGLIVGVVTDAGTYAYKHRWPSDALRIRMENVRALKCVSGVYAQRGTDPSELLERFRPDILVHGDDWETLKEGQETVERLGIEWMTLPYTEGVSTTLLREAASV